MLQSLSKPNRDPAKRSQFGEEEQRNERALTFEKSRRKRYIDLNKILMSIGACFPTASEPSLNQLCQMYDLTLRLMSQELAVIYDRGSFGGQTGQRPLAEQQSTGTNSNAVVTLTFQQPLPSMKKLTEALEEH